MFCGPCPAPIPTPAPPSSQRPASATPRHLLASRSSAAHHHRFGCAADRSVGAPTATSRPTPAAAPSADHRRRFSRCRFSPWRRVTGRSGQSDRYPQYSLSTSLAGCSHGSVYPPRIAPPGPGGFRRPRSAAALPCDRPRAKSMQSHTQTVCSMTQRHVTNVHEGLKGLELQPKKKESSSLNLNRDHWSYLERHGFARAGGWWGEGGYGPPPSPCRPSAAATCPGSSSSSTPRLAVDESSVILLTLSLHRY